MSQYTLAQAMGGSSPAPSSTPAPSAGTSNVGSSSNYYKDAPGYVPGSSPTDKIAPITPSSMSSVSTASVPTAPAVSNTGSNALTSITAQLSTLNQKLVDAQKAGYAATDTINYDASGNIMPKTTSTEASGTSLIQKYLDQAKGLFVTPPKTADLYTTDRAASGIDSKQQLVNNYTAQLNAIVAKSSADKLSLVGQGEGAPEAIIGGKQAQIDREAAIRSLPIAAQLAAAQGDLKLAQDHLDTLFKLHSEDALNQYNYQTKLIDFAFNLADKDEQRALAAKATTVATNHSDLADARNAAQAFASTALANGDTAAFNGLTKLVPPDINSKTFASDLEKYNSQVSKYASTIRPKASAGDTSMANYQAAQKFVKDNPHASPKELEQGIRAHTQGLSEADIQSLIGSQPFLSADYLKGLYDTNSLKDAASTAGYKSAFGRVTDRDVNNYLDHLTGVVDQYRKAGYTDQEILKMMK